MENKKLYAIMSGCYSDWQLHGYMEDREKAMKYCAVRNQSEDEYDRFYIVDLDLIDAEVGNVTLNYYFHVMFDFPKNQIRESQVNYDYYVGPSRAPEATYNVFGDNTGWIRFMFDCESKEKALKIGQDKFAQFLAYYSENQDYEMSAELVGGKHV